MSINPSYPQFARWVDMSGLAEPATLAALQSELEQRRGQEKLTTVDYAHRLQQSGVLTEWQIGHLRLGQFRHLRLGDYKLLQPISEEQDVYLGEHLTRAEKVAVKVMAPGRSGEKISRLARFKIEWEALKRLQQHPNVVQGLEYGTNQRLDWFTMEYLEGSDLSQLVRQQPPLDMQNIVDIFRQAAASLAAAHLQGIIHRDVKPGNFMYLADGTLKLIDFGVALVHGCQHLSKTQRFLGTAGYVAPEQVLDSVDIDHRADLYSLGGTIYFLLTGRSPFVAEDKLGHMRQHLYDEPESLHIRRPDTPQPLVHIVEKLLRKDPDQRFQTAVDVAQALQSVTMD